MEGRYDHSMTYRIPYLTLIFLLPALFFIACGDSGGKKEDSRILYPDWGKPNVDGTSPTKCDASNCYGCCQGDTCIIQTNDTACGFGGGACLPCSSKQSCKGGQCVETTCDSTNCTGCCDTTKVCQNGTSDSVCGTGGAACTACTSTQACLNQKCTLKSSGQYKVILGSITMEKGVSCDTFGKCDLYVELTVGSTQATSTTKAGTDQPVWNETLLIATQSQITSKFEAKVMDDDWPIDESMGTCKPTITSTDLAAGKITTECGRYMSYGFLRTCMATFNFKAN